MLFLTMESSLAARLLKQGSQKFPTSGWLFPVSVGLKHTFHADLGDGEKRKEVTVASRRGSGFCSGASILNAARNGYERPLCLQLLTRKTPFLLKINISKHSENILLVFDKYHISRTPGVLGLSESNHSRAHL